jgi:hypothetical protein
LRDFCTTLLWLHRLCLALLLLSCPHNSRLLPPGCC